MLRFRKGRGCMDILVSVIIPIYNMEKYLEECLDSVLNQTLKAIEVICIDDGSTDGTKEILNKYKEKYSNIIVLRQNREGSGSARNKGLAHANGQFIAFMDSDDYYPSENVLEVLYNGAVSSGVKVAGGSLLRNSEGKIRNQFGHIWNKMRFESDRIIRFSEYQYCYGYYRFIFNNGMLRENNLKFPVYVRNQDPIFMIEALSCANEMWVTSKDIYVVRTFDKKIKLNSKKVMCDIARGIYDVLHFSGKHDYRELIDISIVQLKNFQIYFWVHILNGNQELGNILKDINSELLTLGNINSNVYCLHESINDMKDYVKKYTKKINEYVQIMEKFEEIIVYGVGKIGKSVFDLIQQRDNLKFGGFAVSQPKPEGTARGIEVHCINEFLNKKDKVLVIISAEPPISDEMEENSKKLGFNDRLTITEELLDIDNFEIINDKFAV